MASIITATTTSGLTQSADNSGVLQLASGTGNLVTIPSVTGTAMVSGNMPAFSAYGNTNQTISTNTDTKAVINVENFDTANCYDSTTNYRFTPNVAGYYQVNFSLEAYSASNITSIQSKIFKNGSETIRGSVGTLTSAYMTDVYSNGSNILYMNGTTDYIELYAYVVSGGTITLYGSSIYKFFSACLIRSA